VKPCPDIPEEFKNVSREFQTELQDLLKKYHKLRMPWGDMINILYGYVHLYQHAIIKNAIWDDLMEIIP